MALTKAMSDGVTPENIKTKLASWTEADIEHLTSLINKSYSEINLKFYRQIKGVKKLPEIDLTKIKNNKSIYDAFVKKRDEHIYYFKKFVKYSHGKLVEHLEKSKETLNFDAQDLANTLHLVEGINRRHANFIARDQLGKFSSAINEAQAEYIGATEYIWRTSLDSRVRPEHAAREDKKFRYDKPPAGGNPGMDYRCRCTAEAIIHL